MTVGSMQAKKVACCHSRWKQGELSLVATAPIG
jgi:hypothetical protein